MEKYNSYTVRLRTTVINYVEKKKKKCAFFSHSKTPFKVSLGSSEFKH
jgi:hypothetical protein